jgi:hypothetical protein
MPATTKTAVSKTAAAAATPKTPKKIVEEQTAAVVPDAPKKASKGKSVKKEEGNDAVAAISIDFGSDSEMELEGAAAASAVTSEKKKAGRPKGSKNKSKADADLETEKVKKPRATKKAAAEAAAAAASSDDEGTVAAEISDVEGESSTEDVPKKAPKKRLTKAQKEANAAIEAALEKFEAEQEAANAAFRATLGLPPRIAPTFTASALEYGSTDKKTGKGVKKPRAASARKPINLPVELGEQFRNVGVVAFKTATNKVVAINAGYAAEGYHSISAVVTHESEDVATVEDYLTGASLEEMPVLGSNECLKVIDPKGDVTFRNAEDEEIAPEMVVTEVTGSYFENVPEKAADKEKFDNFKNALYKTGFFTTQDVFTLLNFVRSQMCAAYPDETRSTIEVEKKNRKGETEMAASGHHFRIYGTEYVAFFEYVRQAIMASAATGDEKTLEKIANMRSRTVTRVPTKKASEKAAEKGLPAPEAHEEYVEGAFPEGDSFDYNENVPLTFIMQFKPFLLNSSHDEEEGSAMEETA